MDTAEGQIERSFAGRIAALFDIGRRHAGRMTAQEYAPFVAWIIAWAAIAAAIGASRTVLLMAAHGFVQAVRSLLSVQSYDALAARRRAPPLARARSRDLVVTADLTVLVGSVALLGLFASAMGGAGQSEFATMLLLAALGLPARTPCALALPGRPISSPWRLGSALTVAGGAGLVLALDMSWVWAALAVGVREWGGLIAAWLFAREAPTPLQAKRLHFPELATRTSLAARRRLVYRLGKAVLSPLGPVGGLLARTGRGSGVDGRVALKWKLNKLVIIALVGGCASASAALVLTAPYPATLLLASVLARVAATASSALLWWHWATPESTGDEWLNEDL